MTDSAIRTEADLQERIESMYAEGDALTIGRGVVELLSLGFGIFSYIDWPISLPGFAAGTGLNACRWDATRYADKADEHTEPCGSSGIRPHSCRIVAYGISPQVALASLLSEARTKAAPK